MPTPTAPSTSCSRWRASACSTSSRATATGRCSSASRSGAGPPRTSWRSGSSRACCVRGRTGSAGPVHTSLAQGGLVPMAMHWQRAETPSPSLEWRHAEEQHHGHAVRVRRRRVDPPHGQNRAVAADAGGDRRARDRRRCCRRSRPARSDPVTRATSTPTRSCAGRARTGSRTSGQTTCPVQPAVPLGEILHDEQSRANDYVLDLDDPVAGRITVPGLPLTITPPAACAERRTRARRAHRRGARRVEAERARARRETSTNGADAQRWPLEGVKVLDLGNFLAGPYGAMLLADLGADVIKLESSTGDQMRGVEWSFVGCQRGKRSIAIDLKSADARPVARSARSLGRHRAPQPPHARRAPARCRLRVGQGHQPRDRLLPHELLRATRRPGRLARIRPALPVVVRMGGRGRRRGQPADVAPARVHGPPVRALVGRLDAARALPPRPAPARGSSSPGHSSARA